MLRIEIDGHFHGGPAPKPWVARVDGPDERYGLQREFVSPLNDWGTARRAWSGNTYGVVATFPLRDGHLYEVSRCRGTRVVREFFALSDGKRKALAPEEALALAERDELPAVILRVRETEDRPWVAEITGLGTPRRLGFVLVDGERRYRLRPGRLYEVREIDLRGDEQRRLVVTDSAAVVALSPEEAFAWLNRR